MVKSFCEPHANFMLILTRVASLVWFLVFHDLHETSRRHFRDLHTLTLNKLAEEKLTTFEDQKMFSEQLKRSGMRQLFPDTYKS